MKQVAARKKNLPSILFKSKRIPNLCQTAVQDLICVGLRSSSTNYGADFRNSRFERASQGTKYCVIELTICSNERLVLRVLANGAIFRLVKLTYPENDQVPEKRRRVQTRDLEKFPSNSIARDVLLINVAQDLGYQIVIY